MSNYLGNTSFCADIVELSFTVLIKWHIMGPGFAHLEIKVTTQKLAPNQVTYIAIASCSVWEIKISNHCTRHFQISLANGLLESDSLHHGGSTFLYTVYFWLLFTVIQSSLTCWQTLYVHCLVLWTSNIFSLIYPLPYCFQTPDILFTADQKNPKVCTMLIMWSSWCDTLHSGACPR